MKNELNYPIILLIWILFLLLLSLTPSFFIWDSLSSKSLQTLYWSAVIQEKLCSDTQASDNSQTYDLWHFDQKWCRPPWPPYKGRSHFTF